MQWQKNRKINLVRSKGYRMRDLYNRQIDYLRISITECCNLRCTYCMPDPVCVTQDKTNQMSFDEIIKLATSAAKIGIKKIKITGGEPLLRSDVYDLIRKIKCIPGIEIVTLTTNGVLLSRNIEKLVAAKLDGINISLDTLNPNEYKNLTGSDVLSCVLEGIEAAVKAGISKIKINTVAIGELNRDELTTIVKLAEHEAIHVRFIELMPIGYGKTFTPISKEVILKRLEMEYGKLEPCCENLGNGPATYYSIEGFKGKVGFISAVSHAFCEQCNRIRVTADGYLKLCLHYNEGVDLKPYLAPEVSEECLASVIKNAIQTKPQRHSFNESIKDLSKIENKRMSQIGG
ncbi:MAG: GTP 3',8-cyclase MoaA [Cellulosilyticaceae bacterium]